MEASPNVPSLSLVINLTNFSTTAATGPTEAKTMASQLDSLNIPATWVISEPRQAKMLADHQLATTGHELALTVTARSPQRLRVELANAQVAVQAVSGYEVSTVVGDPQQLRSRAALLADLGIMAVISESQPNLAKPLRPLPCGLWQLDPAVTLPRSRRLWTLLPGRRVTAQQLFESAPQQVVTIDLGRTNARDLQGYGQLLQEIAEAVQEQQLQVATIQELIGQLASKIEIKPQRSILRAA